MVGCYQTFRLKHDNQSITYCGKTSRLSKISIISVRILKIWFKKIPTKTYTSRLVWVRRYAIQWYLRQHKGGLYIMIILDVNTAKYRRGLSCNMAINHQWCGEFNTKSFPNRLIFYCAPWTMILNDYINAGAWQVHHCWLYEVQIPVTSWWLPQYKDDVLPAVFKIKASPTIRDWPVLRRTDNFFKISWLFYVYTSPYMLQDRQLFWLKFAHCLLVGKFPI